MASDDTSNIAGEAEDTRERISATIDELQDRLNPRRIVEDAVDSVHKGGSDLINSGLGLARAHPLTLGAIGIALGLAVLGASRVRNARVDLGEDYESFSDYDDNYEAGRRKPASEHFALSRGDDGGGNPFIGVFVGLAAGALAGALFPETEQERRLLGRSSQRFVAAARDRVDDFAGRARQGVQAALDTATPHSGHDG